MILRQQAVLVPIAVFLLFSFTFNSADAALLNQVNQAFRQVNGRTPTKSEWSYWANRVQRKEKKTYTALIGAMSYQKGRSGGTAIVSKSTPVRASAATKFRISKKYYPSRHNPNFLPTGTLVKNTSRPEVYYIRNGKKSWVIPGVLNKWLKENHFFKSNTVITISDSDLARYPQASSVNKIYIGKVLRHPNGTQFYIDDRLRKRKIASPAIRSKLHFPAGNIYPTSSVHLSEFKTGPTLTSTSKYPGGMAIYDGPYHGGRIWKTKEAHGVIKKHLYLKDRFYEADGYPDESQRAPVNAKTLARHPRGSNIDRYPDGWLIGVGNNIYLMQGGKKRLITTPQIFAAMGYKPHHVHKEYPKIYAKYAEGQPIRAFKNITAKGSAKVKGVPRSAPSTATHLTKVRPNIRNIISRMNTIYMSVFDKDPTVSENKFWVDYIYNGEVNSKTQLIAAMKRTKATGKKPRRTSRRSILNESTLENKWFPYLFYFVHGKDANDDDRDYWFSRINNNDRNSIEKLGGTLQWLKETSGLTHK